MASSWTLTLGGRKQTGVTYSDFVGIPLPFPCCFKYSIARHSPFTSYTSAGTSTTTTHASFDCIEDGPVVMGLPLRASLRPAPPRPPFLMPLATNRARGARQQWELLRTPWLWPI